MQITLRITNQQQRTTIREGEQDSRIYKYDLIR